MSQSAEIKFFNDRIEATFNTGRGGIIPHEWDEECLLIYLMASLQGAAGKHIALQGWPKAMELSRSEIDSLSSKLNEVREILLPKVQTLLHGKAIEV